MERQKFFYKLCVNIKGRLFFYCNQSAELEIGQVISQDIGLGGEKVVVYRNPEQAILLETRVKVIGLGVKLNKTRQKTVIKAMCWGMCCEDRAGFVFSNMCVVENIGFPKIGISIGKENSFLKPVNGKNRRVEITPRSFRSSQRSSPFSGFSGSIVKEITLRNRKNASVPRARIRIDEMLKRMKEESEKIDKEIEDIERWNMVCGLEVIETEKSSEILGD